MKKYIFKTKSYYEHSKHWKRVRILIKELFNNAPAGYIIYSKTNKLLKVNKPFSKIVDVPQKKILGTFTTDHINHRDQDNFYFHKKKLLEDKECRSIKIKIHKSEVIAITNLIELKDEIHFKTIFIELPKKINVSELIMISINLEVT